MSLIRCLSNPEGLYIWGDGSCYNIATGRDWELSNIGPDDPIMMVPYATFGKVAHQWHKSWGTDDVIEFDGFRVENDLHVFTDTLDPVPAGWGMHEILAEMEGEEIERRETFWGLKISYKDLYTYLYKVTWVYAIRRFEESET